MGGKQIASLEWNDGILGFFAGMLSAALAMDRCPESITKRQGHDYVSDALGHILGNYPLCPSDLKHLQHFLTTINPMTARAIAHLQSTKGGR